MNVEVIIVLVALVGMLAALIMDKMRPGMILFSVVVLFLCTGIRQSGALTQVIKKLLPQEKTSVFKAQIRMLPSIAFISAFLNNTPVVVIFAPIIKRWASSVKLPATYFLIPLSYVTILGGICTLIGTSTNLVVHSMIQEAGLKGFSMFELGKVGVFIAIAGIIYLFLFSSKLLPSDRPETSGNEEEEQNSTLHLVEAVIGPRFPGINKRVGDFNFKRHYGAEIKELRRSGHTYTDLGNIRFREGDTLVVLTDDSFIRTWGESSVFLMLANGKDYEPAGKKKRWFALILLLILNIIPPQLLMNLLENSIDYSREIGLIKVVVESKGSEFTCKIADAGIGISETDLPHVWDRFFRGDPLGAGEGHFGLGLSVVKWIAEVHDGWVDAESILGSGSCFTVGMPCEPKPEAEVEEVSEEEKTVDALLEGINGTDETEEEKDADLTTEAEGAVETDATTEEAETEGITEINTATETEAVTENRDSSEESDTLGETIAMPVITEDAEEQSSENFVPDAEKDETDVKSENSFRKIKICLSKIKSFLEEEDDEEDDEEDSDEDEEASNECEVIPFKSKEDSDEK